jgi:hypothetical protein
MSVAKGQLVGLVSHEVLDCSEIHAVHDQSAREGVPKIVPAEVLDLGGSERRLEYPPDEVLGIEGRLALLAREPHLLLRRLGRSRRSSRT